MILASLLVFKLVTMPLGLEPADYAYRCDVQGLLPQMKRVDGALIAVDGDVWRFDDTFARLTGVEQATGTVVDDVMTLEAVLSDNPAARFVAHVVVSDEHADNYGLDWTVRGPVAGVDENALMRSGVAMCHFGPVGIRTGDTQ